MQRWALQSKRSHIGELEVTEAGNWSFWLILLIASDLLFNACLPECVVLDTNLVKLLRIICSLPMDRVEGYSIGCVMTCTWHFAQHLPLGCLFIQLLKLFLFVANDLRPLIFWIFWVLLLIPCTFYVLPPALPSQDLRNYCIKRRTLNSDHILCNSASAVFLRIHYIGCLALK